MRQLCLHVITQDREDLLRKQLPECLGMFDVIRYCDGANTPSTRRLIKDIRRGISWGKGTKVEYHHRRWDDDYAAQDNHLLKKAKPGDWIMIQDSDEIPSRELLTEMRFEISVAERRGFDMISLPALTMLDGVMTEDVTSFVQEVSHEEREPFRKEWLFRYDRSVKSFGSPHREVRRFAGKDAFGQKQWVKDWRVMPISYPYIHTKTRMEFAWIDVMLAWLDPVGSGYSVEEAQAMYRMFPKTIGTTRDLQDFLREGRIPEEAFAWAESNRDRPEAIRNWWPVISECVGGAFQPKVTGLD